MWDDNNPHWNEEKEKHFERVIEEFKNNHGKIPTLEQEAEIWEQIFYTNNLTTKAEENIE